MGALRTPRGTHPRGQVGLHEALGYALLHAGMVRLRAAGCVQDLDHQNNVGIDWFFPSLVEK